MFGLTSPTTITGPEDYESQHVHQVYQQIAPHFSATRFKPWPIVERFLREMSTGSVGLDVGCGNGKYLTINPNIYIIGSDRSSNLIRIAHDHKTHDSFVADALDLPHPEARFDFAISIAVIHHFSSSDRRVASIKSILATLKRAPDLSTPGGKALIYVWALEQRNSRRGWDEGHSQDVFVPWVLSKQYSKPSDKSYTSGLKDMPESKSPTHNNLRGVEEGTSKNITYQRYYHLYRKGELEADVVSSGGYVLESGYEKDNWWAICGLLE